jgi:hypothetical protein
VNASIRGTTYPASPNGVARIGNAHLAPMTNNRRFILRARVADGAWLYYSDVGPCITRAHAIEYNDGDVEQRRANATEFFGMTFEAVEVGSVLDMSPSVGDRLANGRHALRRTA